MQKIIRTKGKNSTDYTLRDIYQSYLKDYKNAPVSSIKDVLTDESIFSDIMKNYYFHLMEQVVEHSEVIELPGMGKVRIEKKKMPFKTLRKHNALKPDWQKSKAAGKIIYHLNEHRNNCRYKFKWFAKPAVKGIRCYSFIATRTWKRRLAHILKNDMNRDYFE